MKDTWLSIYSGQCQQTLKMKASESRKSEEKKSWFEFISIIWVSALDDTIQYCRPTELLLNFDWEKKRLHFLLILSFPFTHTSSSVKKILNIVTFWTNTKDQLCCHSLSLSVCVWMVVSIYCWNWLNLSQVKVSFAKLVWQTTNLAFFCLHFCYFQLETHS